MTHHTDAEQLHQLLELVLTELDRKAIPIAYMQEIDRKGKAFIEQAARRAPAAPVPQEPTSKQVVLGAGALLGQPENTADNRHPDWHTAVEKARSVYLAMLAAAPQPPEADIDTQELEHTRREAESLAWNIFNRHFSSDEHYASGRVKFGLCDTLRGVLSQIDNMVAGLVRASEAAPVQLPEHTTSEYSKPMCGAAPKVDPIAWYVTGCSTMLDEHDAKAEAKRCGGCAQAVPLYTEQQVRQLLANHGIQEQST